MNITTLGPANFPSPIRRTVPDRWRIPEIILRDPDATPPAELSFEVAGQREKLFFDPERTRAAVLAAMAPSAVAMICSRKPNAAAMPSPSSASLRPSTTKCHS